MENFFIIVPFIQPFFAGRKLALPAVVSRGNLIPAAVSNNPYLYTFWRPLLPREEGGFFPKPRLADTLPGGARPQRIGYRRAVTTMGLNR